MTLRLSIPDMISPSYFPMIAAVELGFFRDEGLEATLDLVYPVTSTFEGLRDGRSDLVGGSAHAPLYAFPAWGGCKLVCALSQHMYWFLVVSTDVEAARGDLHAVRGLRIGAAPGPIDGLREMLRVTGIDPVQDVELRPVPAAKGAGVSFGVAAAKALQAGELDGFWANGMGAEVAVRGGYGRVLLDARRGEGPAGAQDYTFAAMAATQRMIDERPDEVAAAVRAVVAAQATLRRDPSLATEAARGRFPAEERELVEELIARDAPFYDPRISQESADALNRFAASIGLLEPGGAEVSDVVDDRFLPA
jgi:NitT/TauT family transport system substrate-binding protein